MANNKKRNSKPSEPLSTKDDIINRVFVLYGVFIILGLVIAARLIQVQVADKNVDKHVELMKKNITNIDHKLALRGTIFSRDGKPLALSHLCYEPILDFAADGMTRKYKKKPNKVREDLQLLAKQMALYFNKADAKLHGYEYKSAKQYYDLFIEKLEKRSKNYRSVRIFPRTVSLDDWNMMRKDFPVINYSLGQVYKTEESDQRIRPYDNMALQFLGQCYNQRSTTQYGVSREYDSAKNVWVEKPLYRDTLIRITTDLEKICDSLLAGVNGQTVEQRIAHGFWVPNEEDSRNKEPIDGLNVVTTIDADLQFAATDILRSWLEENNASFGVAMVMEVETGNMLCMVNLTSGEVRGKGYSEEYYNHAMKSVMCPGSTFKLMSTMALLEIGGATRNSRVSMPEGNVTSAKVGAKNVSDTHLLYDDDKNRIMRPNLIEGFSHSSNIYYATSIFNAFKDDPATLINYYNSLGFNSHIGLEGFKAGRAYLPDEKSKRWRITQGGTKIALPELGYGYTIQLPPIHTLAFYNGVANEGKMMAPRFIDRIEQNGNVVETMPYNTLVEKMCSDETLEILYECLSAASEPSRTAQSFVGYPLSIGCKTGTAQIWGKFETKCKLDLKNFKEGFGTTEGKHAYYLGSLVAMIPMEKPKYTVMVAIANEKVDNTSRYYGARISGKPVRDIIDYLYDHDLALRPSVATPDKPYTPLFIKSGRSNEVSTIAELLCNVSSDDSFSSEWCRAISYDNGNTDVKGLSTPTGRVPDVCGMGLVDAIFLLEQQGMKVTHSGYGRVTKQSIAPGTEIKKSKTKIELTLSI